jgi:hypothetical protein
MLEAIFAAYEIVKNRNRHLEEQIMRDERKVRQEQVIKEVGDLSAEGE